MTTTDDDFEFAPDFPDHMEWVNAEHGVSLHAELAGHVVLVWFFTATSQHCRAALPTISFLEHRFVEQPFTVLGVHTGKYPGEQSIRRVERAARRLDLRHPIVLDEQRRIFEFYGCAAWPTFVLVDASGNVRYRGAGLPDRDRIVYAIETLIDEAENDGHYVLERFRSAEPPPPASILAAPRAVAADPVRELLWIADTGHHRVLAVEPATGRVVHEVGRRGATGFGDGAFADATFSSPSGLAVGLDEVFVADTDNHALRVIDLRNDSVRTLVGSGRAGRDLEGGYAGAGQDLNAPHGLALHEGRLLVAMAGSQQLWAVDVPDDTARALAGSGRFGHVDGAAGDAELAQPVALAAGGPDGDVAFVDADAGAVRVLTPADGRVVTLVGAGLTEFGRVDGPCSQARLQHPSGLAWRGDTGELLVIDSLNDAVRRVDADRARVSTVVGADAGLSGPTGACWFDGTLWVCDTDHDRVVRVDVDGGGIAPLDLGLPAPAPIAARVTFAPAQEVELVIPLTPPRGERLHPDVPVHVRLRQTDGHVLLDDVDQLAEPLAPSDDRVVLHALATLDEGTGRFALIVRYVTCADYDLPPHAQVERFDVEVGLDAEADRVAVLTVSVDDPDASAS